MLFKTPIHVLVGKVGHKTCFFICLTSEIGKEEQQVDKEDKDPWWKPKDLKEDLSKGSVTIAFIFS